MSDQAGSGVAKSFWAIGLIALLWNLMGVGAFFGEMSSGTLAAMAIWGAGAFGVAVFGGAIGSLLLLLRKALAEPVFILSLIGVVVQMFYNLVIAKSTTVYGPFEIAMTIMIPVIAAFLVWYARSAKQKGWIS